MPEKRSSGSRRNRAEEDDEEEEAGEAVAEDNAKCKECDCEEEEKFFQELFRQCPICFYDAAATSESSESGESSECSIWTMDPHASVEFHPANCRG